MRLGQEGIFNARSSARLVKTNPASSRTLLICLAYFSHRILSIISAKGIPPADRLRFSIILTRGLNGFILIQHTCFSEQIRKVFLLLDWNYLPTVRRSTKSMTSRSR
jgi:hypothetical protein